MKNLISVLTITALLTPDPAGAAPRRRQTPGATTQQPRQQPRQQQPEADLGKLCDENPFKKITAPKAPAPAVDPATTDLGDEKIGELKFNEHCNNGAAPVRHCHETLARSFISYYRGKKLFDGELKTVCQTAKTEAEKCQNQAETRECAARIYKTVAEKFNEAKAVLDKDAKKLMTESTDHKTLATQILGPAPRPGASTPMNAAIPLPRRPAAERRLRGEATTGETPARANQASHTSTCATEVGHRSFCSHVTAAADARYYSVQLQEASTITGRSATRFQDLANRTTNGPGGDQKKGGLLDSVGGLDGLMKMATLGMMGAGMYCQFSGQCGNQQSQSSLTDPAANNSLGATSPTPSSPNPGQDKSSLGDNDSSKGGSTTAPGADFKTATDTSTSPENFAGAGSGFSSDPGDQEAFKPFQGGLDRTPATAGAPGGGGGGTGGDSSGSTAPSDPLADASKTGGPEAGASGPISGGGGLPSSGGFSLSSSPDAPAADTALKNILNGDTPPGDAGLAAMLDEAGVPGGGSENGGIDLQDSESLFFRVKDTHVRCVKRGCVGQEVGENI